MNARRTPRLYESIAPYSYARRLGHHAFPDRGSLDRLIGLNIDPLPVALRL
jgi:hypothetical protein